jgi:hypothetical protein
MTDVPSILGGYNPEQEQTPQATPLAPVQGAAPSQLQTASILQGAPDLATSVANAFLQHTATIAQNSPVAIKAAEQEKQKKVAAATPVDTSRPPAPAPGSFGSKLAGAAEGVLGSLGDAAHASDTKGGWLSGVANTLNARNERLAREAKDQALLAKTQAETVMMHRNIYQQDAAIRQASYKGNQDFVDTFKVNHDIDEGLTHDELMNRANADKNFAKNYYVRATADEPVLDVNGEPKKDKDGNPITSPTYAVISRATKDGQKDDKLVTPQMSADMDKFLGNKLPANTKLTVDQYASLDTALNNSRNAVNIIDSTNEKPLSDDQMKSLRPYLQDPTIQSAISHVPGSAYAGLQQYQKNADAHIADLNGKLDDAKAQNNQQAYDAIKTQIADITQEKQKVAAFESQAISPKQIERFDKEGDEGIKWVDKVLHDPSALSGDKASSVIPQLQTALAAETDPGRKMKLTQAISAATSARDNYFEDMKRKATADQVAKQGDPVTAGRLLANGEVTLADLRTRQTTTDFIEKAIDEAKKIDGKYNAADEVNFEHQAKSAAAGQFFGASRSLIEKGGTADQLFELGKTIPDNGLPVLNKFNDWVDLSKGKGPLAGYAALALGVADDYAKIMGGGAASDSARDYALHLFAAAQTQEQRMSAIKGLLGGAGSQFHGRVGDNKFFQREYDNFVRSDLSPKFGAQPATPQVGAAPKGAIGSEFRDDVSKRPVGYQGAIQGSDNNWYYYDKNHKILGPAPAQK